MKNRSERQVIGAAFFAPVTPIVSCLMVKMQQKSLFSLDFLDDAIPSSKIKSSAEKTAEKNTETLGKANEKIQAVIGNVSMGETIHYASIGEWSMPELLFHLLGQTGTSDIYLATWSLSESAVRALISGIENGAIRKLIGIFDWRIKVRNPQAYEFIKYNVADIRLTTCHAKVTVIQNDTWSIAIVGSANYTNNPRIEAGVISCDKKAADFHKMWIHEEFKKSDPFETTKKRKRS